MTRLDDLARGLDALLRRDAQSLIELVKATGLDPTRDLRHADLSGLDLRGEDLRSLDLSNARLRDTLVENTRFNDTVSPAQLAEAIHVGNGQPLGPPPSIVVIALGQRGAEIARNVRSPDWYPTSTPGGVGTQIYGITDDEDVGAAGADRSILRAPIGIMPSLLRFDIVVVIADDDVAQDMMSGRGGTRYPSLEKPSIRLLVPAIPKDRPSSILSGAEPLAGPFHAVVDSAVARSPWWSGNPSRALDRRIADIAVGAAMLVDESREVRSVLTDTYTTSSTPLMTFGFRSSGREGHARDAKVTGLASETIGLGEGGPQSTSSRIIDSFDFQPHWTRQRPKDAEGGVLELHGLNGAEVDGFLVSAAQEVVAGSDVSEGAVWLERLEVPDELRRSLKFPEHVAGMEARSGPPLALTAETPDLEMAKAAGALGWRVARYTDTDFISEVLGIATVDTPRRLAGELRLPSWKGWIRNQGLATRGVDPRDVIRVTGGLLATIRSDAPELLRKTRVFRAAFDFDRQAEPVHLLPILELSEWLAQPHFGREDIRALLHTERLQKPKAPKRPADLRAAWTPPEDGDSRFVIADGPIPIRLDMIALDEAPAQSLFFLDGDAAVPALFQSTVFDAWARATTTRSTSWMQRFSVGRTFETFPIALPFRLGRSRNGHGGVILHLDTTDAELSSLATIWLERSGFVQKSHANAQKPLDASLAEVRRALDERILHAYGLPAGAGDLEIMERLLSWVAR